jgi:acetyl esterase/lipase
MFAVQVQRDVLYGSADPYGPVNMQDLRMDIYTPVGDSQQYRPVIVYAFGGAFLVGDKRQPNIPQFCETFAQKGFVVAAIDYRIGFNLIDPASGERAVFRAVQDMRAACRYLAGNAQIYSIDTASFVLTGSSAGCFAALHSSFMDDSEKPGSIYGTLLEPEDLGCGNCSGNLDYGGKTPGVIAVINQWGAIVDTVFINDFPRDSVPVLSFHGTGDLAVPYRSGNPFFYPLFPVVDGSEVIHRRLRNLSVFNQLVPFPGAGHEPQLTNQSIRDTIFKTGTAFLYEVLRPKPGTISGPKAICQYDSGVWELPVKSGLEVHWYLDSAFFQSNSGMIKMAFADTGLHQLFAWVENRHGAKSYGGAFSFYVHPAPRADFVVATSDSLAWVIDSSAYGNIHYWWGDGFQSMDTVHTYAAEGVYSITQIAELGSCKDSIKQAVEIDFCPIADFAFTPFNQGFLFLDQSIYEDSTYWDFGDGSAYLNDINPYHQYLQAGNYRVVLTALDGNCMDTASIEIYSTGTGIVGTSNVNFAVYPNPFDGYLEIEGFEGDVAHLRIFNSIGEVIFAQSELSLPAHIDLGKDLASGLYMIELRTEKQVWKTSLIKK